MRPKGWDQRYVEILQEFGFKRSDDEAAARLLDSLLAHRQPLNSLKRKIGGRTVFVIGAGPSLSASVKTIKKFRDVTNIVADGATKALIENGIRPDIVVTDLDGSLEYLKKAARLNSTMVVHAHGDNIGRLPLALLFRGCIGTTEGKPFGKIRNFGGFTDGDRCVFLASYFGAKQIVLFGMDLGRKVGSYSKEGRYDRALKIAKLEKAKTLLEWLAPMCKSKLYTTSTPLRGFQSIRFDDLEELVSG